MENRNVIQEAWAQVDFFLVLSSLGASGWRHCQLSSLPHRSPPAHSPSLGQNLQLLSELILLVAAGIDRRQYCWQALPLLY